MAKMLRNTKGLGVEWGDFGCCDHCARHKALHRRPGPRERHLARQREKRQWKKDIER